jgi:hypothetical protein
MGDRQGASQIEVARGVRVTARSVSWLVGGLGLVLLLAGVMGAADAWPAPSFMIVFAAGAACLLVALVADRLARLEAGPDRDDRTAVRCELSRIVMDDIIETGLPAAAAIYSFVHTQLADDPGSLDVKVRLQGQVVEVVQQNAFVRPVGAAQIEQVLATGTQAERVLAFGLMQRDTRLATVPRLVQGLAFSRSGNEQYHALLATKARWPALTDIERHRLADVISTAPYVDDDWDRRELKDEILGNLPPSNPYPAERWSRYDRPT